MFLIAMCLHQDVVIWTMSLWSQFGWVLASLHPGWRSAIVRQVTKASSVSVALQAIKDVSLDRVAVASVSHVPVGEEAVILKQVRYATQNTVLVY